MTNLKISYHLKDIRCQKNLTVRDLAEASGVSKSQISDIENELKHPSVYTLCLLAYALDEPPIKLFTVSILDKKK